MKLTNTACLWQDHCHTDVLKKDQPPTFVEFDKIVNEIYESLWKINPSLLSIMVTDEEKEKNYFFALQF